MRYFSGEEKGAEASDESDESDGSDCLINQASYLLHRQIERLEHDFVEQGGFTERLYKVRSESRVQIDPIKPSADVPACPLCGGQMRLRKPRQGPWAGKEFWGCASLPGIRGTRKAEAQGPEARREISKGN